MEDLGISLIGVHYGASLLETDLEEGRLVVLGLGDDLEVEPDLQLVDGWPTAERMILDDLPVRRKRTWVGGRLALRRALAGRAEGDLGASQQSLVADDRGAVALPAGITGSIAHKDPVAVAIVARETERRIGLDVELVGRLPSLRIAPKVLDPAEIEELLGSQRSDGARALALVRAFCAKEAIYKAIDPFVRRYVGFHEVRLSGDPSRYVVEPALRMGEDLRIEARTFCAGDVVIAVARAARS